MNTKKAHQKKKKKKKKKIMAVYHKLLLLYLAGLVRIVTWFKDVHAFCSKVVDRICISQIFCRILYFYSIQVLDLYHLLNRNEFIDSYIIQTMF